jgi:hypothetical protein
MDKIINEANSEIQILQTKISGILLLVIPRHYPLTMQASESISKLLNRNTMSLSKPIRTKLGNKISYSSCMMPSRRST